MSIFQKKRRYSFLFLKIKGRERAEIARSEMKIMRALPDHPNIVKFVAGSLIEIEDGGLIGLYLMELCEGGSLFDLMQKHMENRFREAHLVHIMREVC
jgi:serine/threonine protein kinase